MSVMKINNMKSNIIGIIQTGLLAFSSITTFYDFATPRYDMINLIFIQIREVLLTPVSLHEMS